MERPKKINTSFLLLVLLFMLTQTAYALSATISYDGLTENVQENITKEENLLIENEKTDSTNYQDTENAQAALNTESSTIQASASSNMITFNTEPIPASAVNTDLNDTEIIIEPELNKIIPAPMHTPDSHSSRR